MVVEMSSHGVQAVIVSGEQRWWCRSVTLLGGRLWRSFLTDVAQVLGLGLQSVIAHWNDGFVIGMVS
jgi:hypothetical protein